ncbi:hypothetical protein FAIPA1_50211 [Frankia sp. AiPs1]
MAPGPQGPPAAGRSRSPATTRMTSRRSPPWSTPSGSTRSSPVHWPRAYAWNPAPTCSARTPTPPRSARCSTASTSPTAAASSPRPAPRPSPPPRGGEPPHLAIPSRSAATALPVHVLGPLRPVRVLTLAFLKRPKPGLTRLFNRNLLAQQPYLAPSTRNEESCDPHRHHPRQHPPQPQRRGCRPLGVRRRRPAQRRAVRAGRPA